MTVNRKAKKTLSEKKHERVRDTKSHRNFMDGESYDISNPLTQLKIVAASCFFGEPNYYNHESMLGKILHETVLGDLLTPPTYGMSPAQVLESVIDKALDYSVEGTLKVAAALRNEDNIRTTPQVILVRAASHPNSKGTNLIREYAKLIVRRADEPAVCVSYHMSTYKKVMPSSLKRALADVLETFSEYQLAKYRMDSRDVKTVDVVNLVHPKSTPAIASLVKGTLKNSETWESMRSAGKSWTECLPVMGHMALLRNLRNVLESKEDVGAFLSKLQSTVENGKQLPFRYYTAYRELEKVSAPGYVLDAIETCLITSLHNVPTFKGRTMSLCDNSGSARGTMTSSHGTVHICDIANLTALITAKVSDDGHVGIFGDTLDIMSIRKNSSIFDDLKRVDSSGQNIGQGTENGIWLFWRDAITKREHWDNVFVYSDMQAGHGGLYGINPSEYTDYVYGNTRASIDVASLVNTYRKKVNPKVNVFLVQVAGYKDTIIPETYDRTYILGGWGDGILQYAGKMINLTNG